MEPPSTLEPRWHSRGYLPHFESNTAIQHIVFRLADSLPQDLVRRLHAAIQRLPVEQQDIQRRKRIEAWMDSGYGSCALRNPEIAALVQKSLLAGDDERYRLIAWVVMPNHVHALIQPLGGWTVAKIVASWKSFTGRRISEWMKKARLEPGGPGKAASLKDDSRELYGSVSATRIWHREYWDRYARDETHLAQFIDYIHQNPVKAKLAKRPEDWPWSSAHPGTARLQPDSPI